MIVVSSHAHFQKNLPLCSRCSGPLSWVTKCCFAHQKSDGGGHGRAETPAVSLPVPWNRSCVDLKEISSLSCFLILRAVPPTRPNHIRSVKVVNHPVKEKNKFPLSLISSWWFCMFWPSHWTIPPDCCSPRFSVVPIKSELSYKYLFYKCIL